MSVKNTYCRFAAWCTAATWRHPWLALAWLKCCNTYRHTTMQCLLYAFLQHYDPAATNFTNHLSRSILKFWHCTSSELRILTLLSSRPNQGWRHNKTFPSKKDSVDLRMQWSPLPPPLQAPSQHPHRENSNYSCPNLQSDFGPGFREHAMPKLHNKPLWKYSHRLWRVGISPRCLMSKDNDSFKLNKIVAHISNMPSAHTGEFQKWWHGWRSVCIVLIKVS